MQINAIKHETILHNSHRKRSLSVANVSEENVLWESLGFCYTSVQLVSLASLEWGKLAARPPHPQHWPEMLRGRENLLLFLHDSRKSQWLQHPVPDFHHPPAVSSLLCLLFSPFQERQVGEQTNGHLGLVPCELVCSSAGRCLRVWKVQNIQKALISQIDWVKTQWRIHPSFERLRRWDWSITLSHDEPVFVTHVRHPELIIYSCPRWLGFTSPIFGDVHRCQALGSPGHEHWSCFHLSHRSQQQEEVHWVGRRWPWLMGSGRPGRMAAWVLTFTSKLFADFYPMTIWWFWNGNILSVDWTLGTSEKLVTLLLNVIVAHRPNIYIYFFIYKYGCRIFTLLSCNRLLMYQ